MAYLESGTHLQWARPTGPSAMRHIHSESSTSHTCGTSHHNAIERRRWAGLRGARGKRGQEGGEGNAVCFTRDSDLNNPPLVHRTHDVPPVPAPLHLAAHIRVGEDRHHNQRPGIPHHQAAAVARSKERAVRGPCKRPGLLQRVAELHHPRCTAATPLLSRQI